MTCGIGLVCQDGILLASDSLVTGPTKLTMPDLKGFEWRGLEVLFAGDLTYIQKLQTYPSAGYAWGTVKSFQQLIWDYPVGKGDEAEFLVVDAEWKLWVVDKWGSAVRMRDYAIVGAAGGWYSMGMVDQKERTMKQAKRVAAKVLRNVARLDDSVAEPFRYKELGFE